MTPTALQPMRHPFPAFILRLGLLLALLLLLSCAQPRRVAIEPGQTAAHWAGRLALRVESEQVQAFTAGFELSGDARNGTLSLFSPLGSTMAQLAWSPSEAKLRWDGKQRTYASLNAMIKDATGTDIPIAHVFRWLAGEEATAEGWQADLRELGNGRLIARRNAPLPAVEMRLVLE